MWGAGAYFAVNSSYSYNYSYELSLNDEQKYAGKKIFLCCKVSLGKAHNCNPDNSLKRPPQIPNTNPPENFDSITGITNGSQV